MDSWTSNLAPSLIFFLFFFVGFSFIELLIIIFLGRLQKKHWEFVIDHLIRMKVHHGKLLSVIGASIILVAVLIVYFFTPFTEILISSSTTQTVLSICLLLVMVLIYLTTTLKMTRMALEKKVHGYIYFITSFILFVFIVIIADTGYTNYQQYINRKFVDPTVKEFQAKLDKQEEERLLNLFRKDYLEGNCIEVDYGKEEGLGLIHFIYITTDIEFATMQTPKEPGAPIQGYECSDGENTFIMTDEGKWYWVIMSDL